MAQTRFDGTQIHDQRNHIRVPVDLNATVAPADVNQNIGIHYSFGQNQTIQNNTIDMPGNGVSDSGRQVLRRSSPCSRIPGVADIYDGLLIDNNTINITSAQSVDPSIVLGIWENGFAMTSDITVSNNDFLNLDLGNNPATNLQSAFRVTSHSSPTTTVDYYGQYGERGKYRLPVAGRV